MLLGPLGASMSALLSQRPALRELVILKKLDFPGPLVNDVRPELLAVQWNLSLSCRHLKTLEPQGRALSSTSPPTRA